MSSWGYAAMRMAAVPKWYRAFCFGLALALAAATFVCGLVVGAYWL